MSLFFSSHNPSLLFHNNPFTTTTTPSFPISPSFHLHPTTFKSTSIPFSSNKPPSSSGWNPVDQTVNDDEESYGSQSPKFTDEWGDKSKPENEQMTKLTTSDPPQEDDEWGTSVNGIPVVEDNNNKVDELKRSLVERVYGTGFGYRASQEERALILELVLQIEGENPTPAPTDALELLDGNWVLLFTAFSAVIPLLAVGTNPLLKVDKACQEIITSSLTINDSMTFSSAFATFTFTASGEFEVRSSRVIQVQLKEGSFLPPKIKSDESLPENVDIFGQNVNLSPLQQFLNPLQEAVANLAGVISGQSPLKVPIPAERSKSWFVITYLDKDLRISKGDGGIFVFIKEGSPLFGSMIMQSKKKS